MSAHNGIILTGEGNGLSVKLNLWALEKYKENFTPQMARHHIKGMATNGLTGEKKMFNDAGQLLSIVGHWNASQLRRLKKAARAK